MQVEWGGGTSKDTRAHAATWTTGIVHSNFSSVVSQLFGPLAKIHGFRVNFYHFPRSHRLRKLFGWARRDPFTFWSLTRPQSSAFANSRSQPLTTKRRKSAKFRVYFKTSKTKSLSTFIRHLKTFYFSQSISFQLLILPRISSSTRPDSSKDIGGWRYISHVLNYLLTYLKQREKTKYIQGKAWFVVVSLLAFAF